MAATYSDPVLERIRRAVEATHSAGKSDVKMASEAGVSQPSARAFRLGDTEDPKWPLVIGMARAAGLRVRVVALRQPKPRRS